MKRGIIAALLLLSACTQTTVMQITPRKDPRHPVPPPKGWIYEAADTKKAG